MDEQGGLFDVRPEPPKKKEAGKTFTHVDLAKGESVSGVLIKNISGAPLTINGNTYAPGVVMQVSSSVAEQLVKSHHIAVDGKSPLAGMSKKNPPVKAPNNPSFDLGQYSPADGNMEITADGYIELDALSPLSPPFGSALHKHSLGLAPSYGYYSEITKSKIAKAVKKLATKIASAVAAPLFTVKCDEENNPPEAIDKKEMHVDIEMIPHPVPPDLPDLAAIQAKIYASFAIPAKYMKPNHMGDL